MPGGLACLVLVALATGCGGDESAAGSWHAPIEISAPAEVTNGRQVAVDAGGDAVAVWATTPDPNSANSIVHAAQRPADGRWQKPVRLSAAGVISSAAQIAVDRRGNAVAVWERSSGSSGMSFVESATRPAGGSWQAATQVSRAGAGPSGPDVGIDGQGNAVAVWQRTGAGRSAVQSAVRSAGPAGRWGTPVDIARLSAASKGFAVPRVAVNAHGDAVAVWTNVSVGNMGVVEAATRRAGGAWQTAAPLSRRGGRSFTAEVAIGPKGDAAAVWADNANQRVQAAVRRARGDRWQPPEYLSERLPRSPAADVAVDARGNAIAAWGALHTVQEAVRPAGEGWQRPATIADGPGNSDVSIGLDARGGVIAAWMEYEGQAVRSAVRTAGGRWQEPVLVSPRTPALEASGAQLSLAVAPDGRAVAVFGRARETAYVAVAAAYGPR